MARRVEFDAEISAKAKILTVRHFYLRSFFVFIADGRLQSTSCIYHLEPHARVLACRYEWPVSPDGSKADGSYDITDAYLVARYSWHRDVFRAVADDKSAKDRYKQLQYIIADPFTPPWLSPNGHRLPRWIHTIYSAGVTDILYEVDFTCGSVR